MSTLYALLLWVSTILSGSTNDACGAQKASADSRARTTCAAGGGQGDGIYNGF